MSESFELRNTDSFTAAAIGPPGQRIFFLQGVDGDQVVTLKLEKVQVGALATALKQLLDKHNLVEPLVTLMPLREPVLAEWTVAELGAGLDPDTGTIVVVAREQVNIGDSDAAPNGQEQATALFHLRPELVGTFCEHALRLVDDGRDFAKRNGHRPRQN